MNEIVCNLDVWNLFTVGWQLLALQFGTFAGIAAVVLLVRAITAATRRSRHV
jgi:hypothetical protein